MSSVSQYCTPDHCVFPCDPTPPFETSPRDSAGLEGREIRKILPSPKNSPFDLMENPVKSNVVTALSISFIAIVFFALFFPEVAATALPAICLITAEALYKIYRDSKNDLATSIFETAMKALPLSHIEDSKQIIKQKMIEVEKYVRKNKLDPSISTKVCQQLLDELEKIENNRPLA